MFFRGVSALTSVGFVIGVPFRIGPGVTGRLGSIVMPILPQPMDLKKHTDFEYILQKLFDFRSRKGLH